MKARVLISSFLFLLLISYSGMAQVPDLISSGKKAELKSNVVGSYPTEIWKYRWIVEFWSIMEKTTIAYTDFGAITEITVNGDDGNLHTIYTYNQDHTVSEIIIQKKEGQEWVNDRRERFEYDGMGNTTSIITESWFNSEWMISVGFQYVYEMSDGQVVGIVEKLWSRDDQDWINSTKQTISYSEDLSVIESVSQTWEEGAWENSSLSRTTIADGRISETILSGWLDEAWVESSKMVYEYGNFESSTITFYTGPGDGNWTPSQRLKENLDSHGNTLLSTVEVYFGSWMIFSGSQYTLSYDGDNLIQRITQKYSITEPSIPGSKTTGAWKNQYKEEFKDFATLSTSPLVIGDELIEHFPNPAMESVNLRFKNLKGEMLKITLMNLDGQAYHLDDIFIPGDEFLHILDLKKLPAGIFILQARDKSGKLISSLKLMHKK